MKRRMIIFLFSIGYALLAGIFVYAASATYSVELGVVNPIGVNVRWAIPEGRVGASSTNWDTTFFLTARQAGVVLDSMDTLATTTVAGEHLDPILFFKIIPGVYDLTIKTNQHLTRKLSGVNLVQGLNTLNFSQADNNTSSIGSVVLLAGDVNGAGNSTTTLGDDVVNSVDLGIMLNNLDTDDLTTRGNRANLNQDTVVNAVDLSLMINNLDKQGD